MKKITFLVGSIRKDSFNRQLAQQIINHLPSDIEGTISDISHLPFMNEDQEFPAPKAVEDLRQQVTDSDGLWLVSPEYNNEVSGVLKNATDWLSRTTKDSSGKEQPAVLRNKPVAVSDARFVERTDGARKALVGIMDYVGAKPLHDTVGILVSKESAKSGKLALSDQQLSQIKQEIDNFTKLLN